MSKQGPRSRCAQGVTGGCPSTIGDGLRIADDMRQASSVRSEDIVGLDRAVTCGRLCLVMLAAFACAACGGSLFESDIPVPRHYVLAPAPPASSATSSAASAVDLAIGRPDVAPGLDTSRIAVLRGRELDYFRAAQWGGNVTETVQSLLVSTLQDQQLFRSVTAEQTRVSGTYLLDPEVRDFQAEYVDGKSAPDIRVTIVARVIRIGDRRLVDTISATSVRSAAENRMTAVAAAFEAASQQVALELSSNAARIIANDVQAVAAANK